MLYAAWSRADPFWTAWSDDDPSWIRLQATAETAPFSKEFLEKERRANAGHRGRPTRLFQGFGPAA